MSDNDQQTTLEALAKDLAAIVSGANDADAALSKAKDKARNSADQSIRALSMRVATINAPLDNDDIDIVLKSMADKIPGSDSTKKVRKSEIKLALQQRHNIAEVISKIDATNSDREEADKLNVRQTTLKALRALRSPSSDVTTPESAVAEIVEVTDYVPSEEEKMASKLDSLMAHAQLQIKNDEGDIVVHQALEAFRSAVLAAVGGDNHKALDAILNALESSECLESDEETPDEEEQDLGVVDTPVEAEPDDSLDIQIDTGEGEEQDIPELEDDDFDLSQLQQVMV
jgi:hypothetical protein